jgi:DNA-binding transcriptional ArsR family regulator
MNEKQKKLARYAKAMGHPYRVFVLESLLKDGVCYSGALSDQLPIAKSTFSQHTRELKNAGLIHSDIEGQKVKYWMDKDNWKEAMELFKEFLKM